MRFFETSLFIATLAPALTAPTAAAAGAQHDHPIGFALFGQGDNKKFYDAIDSLDQFDTKTQEAGLALEAIGAEIDQLEEEKVGLPEGSLEAEITALEIDQAGQRQSITFLRKAKDVADALAQVDTQLGDPAREELTQEETFGLMFDDFVDEEMGSPRLVKLAMTVKIRREKARLLATAQAVSVEVLSDKLGALEAKFNIATDGSKAKALVKKGLYGGGENERGASGRKTTKDEIRNVLERR